MTLFQKSTIIALLSLRQELTKEHIMQVNKIDLNTSEVSEMSTTELETALSEFDCEITFDKFESHRAYYFEHNINMSEYDDARALLLTLDPKHTIVMHFDSEFDVFITT